MGDNAICRVSAQATSNRHEDHTLVASEFAMVRSYHSLCLASSGMTWHVGAVQLIRVWRGVVGRCASVPFGFRRSGERGSACGLCGLLLLGSSCHMYRLRERRLVEVVRPS
jgi:hypothetical protein